MAVLGVAIAIVAGGVLGVLAMADDGPFASGPTDRNIAASQRSAIDRDSERGSTSGTVPSESVDDVDGNDPDGPNSNPEVEVGADGSPADGSPTIEVVTSVDLEPFLLRGSDLPVGWVTLPASAVGAGDDSCLSTRGLTPDGGRAEARITLRRGESGPFLTNVVVDHFDPDVATAALAAIRSAIEDCAGQATNDGLVVSAPQSLDTSADEALFATISTAQSPDQVGGRLTYARVGRYTTYLLVIGFEGGDSPEANLALTNVIERLRNA